MAATAQPPTASSTTGSASPVLPTLFISHGGGPCFFMDAQKHAMFTNMDKVSRWADLLRNATTRLGVPANPTSILVISAHWEEEEFSLLTPESDKHSLLYDYNGFPKEAYEIKYSVPVARDLNDRVAELLRGAGFPDVPRVSGRGIDHGVFIPLKMMFPRAEIPVAQLSIKSSLIPEEHIRLGRALAALRSEGVLIVASGQATHNLPRASAGFGKQPKPTEQWAQDFEDWLLDVCTVRDGAQRVEQLLKWADAPSALVAHPREEHLIPLHVAVGAAGLDATGKRIIDGMVGGNMSAATFLFE